MITSARKLLFLGAVLGTTFGGVAGFAAGRLADTADAFSEGCEEGILDAEAAAAESGKCYCGAYCCAGHRRSVVAHKQVGGR